MKRVLQLVLAALWVVHATIAASAPAFPVKYSDDRRYLVDQNDVPFPILGRAAWYVLSLPAADYRVFVDDTAARGYTAIELKALTHDPRTDRPPFNGAGVAPFLRRLDGTAWNGALAYGNIASEAPDFGTPNDAYWRFVDDLLAYCESRGLLVFLFPAYVGYQGGEQGWMREMVANGATRMRAYGEWIAGRYRDRRNLVWMMGGDLGTFDASQQQVEGALLDGLKSVAGQHSVQFSAEWSSDSIASDQPAFGNAMTLNGVYSFAGTVTSLGRRAYARTPSMPAFLLEEPYDEEGPDGNGVNPNATQPVRRFQWWGWLSTVGGYISGNGYVWPFRSAEWRAHLDSPGTRDMARLNAFIGSIAWHKLVPSGLARMRTLVVAGGSSVDASDQVTAAAAMDGTLLVAYLPPDHIGPVTIDMAAMAEPSRARWFDPASGAYADIGTALPNTGPRVFTPPASTSVRPRDWVLVIDVPSAPGQTALAIEFYNASLDHYFMTHATSEIDELDRGTTIKGWVRTGEAMKTFATAAPGLTPVCRYYIPPERGDSHFFGRGIQECLETGVAHPEFRLEDATFMRMVLPMQGHCPDETRNVFRVFSNRPDANHRYMTNPVLRDDMVDLGWLAEGDGPDRVVMCAPL